MQKIIKQINPLLMYYMNFQRAEAIQLGAMERYMDLVKENSNDNSALRVHTHAKIYPIIALYEVMLENNVEKDLAYSILHEYIQRDARNMEKAIQSLLKVPGVYHQVPKIFKAAVKHGFSEEAGFRHHFKCNEDDTVFKMDMLRCPYFEKCKKYNHPELTPIFCDSDDTSYGNMHKDLQWKRTKTLGRLNDCCDFYLKDTSR